MLRSGREGDPALVEKEIETLLSMQRTFPDKEEAFILERLGEAYFARGVLSGAEADLEAAADSFRALIDLGYGRASTYLNIAVIEQRRMDYAAAEETLLTLLDRYPNNGDGCIQMAFLIAEREGQKPQSERDYAPVVEYYERAKLCGAAGANLQRLEGVIEDLKSGGWIA